MKKIILFVTSCLALFTLNAGGLLTNQNQSASYMRMPARTASTDGDAVFYNPAGLSVIDNGLLISVSNQFLWQTRTIADSYPALHGSEFEGKMQTPIFPTVYAAYKTGNWVFSFGFNPTAGGGSVKFDNGIPMLEVPIAALPGTVSSLGIPTSDYSMEAMMDGKSIMFGYQAGVTYKIGDMFGVFGGCRMVSASNSYEGYLRNIMINPMVYNPNPGQMISASAFFNAIGQSEIGASLTDQSLNVKQKGTGYTPILGFNFNLKGLNVGLKYEFNTKLTVKNQTSSNAFDMYPDGQELRSDIPALLSIGASYDVVPEMKLSFGYLHYFDKNAVMQSWDARTRTVLNKADYIDKNTSEYLAGIEWKVCEKLVLSSGYQYSKPGPSEKYQNDISHSIANLTAGIGFAYKICEKATINVGGLMSFYDKFKTRYAQPEGSNIFYNRTYDRTSKGFAIGLDLKF